MFPGATDKFGKKRITTENAESTEKNEKGKTKKRIGFLREDSGRVYD